MQHKAEVVQRFTGRAHLRSLNAEQANKLYQDLHNQRTSADKMRKKLIYLAYQMEFNKPENNFSTCLKNLNDWLTEKSPSRKHMNKQNPDELNDSVSQLELVYKKTLKKISNANHASYTKKAHRD